jgi:ubiquinone/menaquinone biosynthesis C-methylase UbiE
MTTHTLPLVICCKYDAFMLADRLKGLHRKMRQQKIDLFLATCTECGTLLDLGGGTGIAMEFLPLYEAFREVHTVNLSVPLQGLPPSTFVIADGCMLPYRDQQFDYVFSNAVIEHIPPRHQPRFASEIRRVARYGYFVATPDRHFPIDPHTLLPGIQFLPLRLRRSYAKLSLRTITESIDGINMLSARDMKTFFPEARIIRMGFPVWPNNLAAIYSS